MSNRNRSIDFFRFFFMLVICIYHYGLQMSPGFHHGYIGVEFFFIVSGAFLWRNYSADKTKSPLDYFVSRIKRLWGPYILALSFYWIVYLVWMLISNVDFSIENYSLRLLSDALMLQGVGLSFRGICTPLWYVGSLLVASTFVFSLLSYNEQLSLRLLLPFGSLIGYTFLAKQGTFDYYYSYGGALFIPIVRAYSGIALGVLLCAISETRWKQLKESLKLINITSILSFFFILIYVSRDVRVDGVNYTDSFLLLSIAVIVMACLVGESFFQRIFTSRCWESLGGVTYEMLLMHSSIMIIVNFFKRYISLNQWVWLAVYLSVVVGGSYAFKYCYRTMVAFRKNKFDKDTIQ